MDTPPRPPDHEVVADALASALHHARVSQGVTQEQIAEALGVAGVTVGRWENGQRSVPIAVLPAVEDRLGFARGTILRRAGLVGEVTSVLDAVDADVELDGHARHLLKLMYRELRRSGSEGFLRERRRGRLGE